MKSVQYIILLLCVLSFVSCVSDDEDYLWLRSDQVINIAPSVNPTSGMPVVSWQDQDSLGLFVKSKDGEHLSPSLEVNRKYIYKSSVSIFELQGQTIYYPQSRSVDLIAYAPYRPNVVDIYTIDVSDQSDLKAIDFLYSSAFNQSHRNSSPVPLNFNHQLSKVNFDIVSNTGSRDGFDDMEINLEGFYDRAEFNLLTGSLQNTLFSPSVISFDTERTGIVIPNRGLSNRKFKFRMNGEDWEHVLTDADVFEPGRVYNYLITINNKKITANLSSITPWNQNSSGIDDTGVINTDPIEYAFIPAGLFQMGAPDTSNTIQSYDKPQHWVRISKSFYMSKHEITIAQYAEFLNAVNVPYGSSINIYHNIDNESTYLFELDARSTPYFENNRWVVMPTVENYPMQGVTWHGAMAYAKWKGATLPTEAQWEYAYRATTKSKFFTGNFGSEMMAYGYYFNNAGGYVRPVGEKLPNPWGLYDIAGNVLEWCLDGPEDDEIVSYPVADNGLAPIVDPIGKISKSGYAYYRGGNYSSTVQLASAYNRNAIRKDFLDSRLGFRIVINP